MKNDLLTVVRGGQDSHLDETINSEVFFSGHTVCTEKALGSDWKQCVNRMT